MVVLLNIMRPRLCRLTSVQSLAKISISIRNITERPTQTKPLDKVGSICVGIQISLSFTILIPANYQDGRVVKALDLSSNGRVVRVGSNPTPGNNFLF